ncbi:hypothetical protein [Fulvimarina endophytica]|nr:hypothetical protein [Fulvimarina endophytica]
MRATILGLATLLVLSACASPSPEVRSAGWENSAMLLTQPAADY